MNNIMLYSVADFLDGRHFFIPAYQRGYRWNKRQMKELLDDLFEFALKDKSEGEFYCLQPIIVQRVTDERKLKEISAVSNWNDVSADNTWEVIDGQQRLTSVYIIYRFLIGMGVVNEQMMELEDKSLYSLCYETHPETQAFLESLSFKTLDWNDIDQKHMAEAFECIKDWLKNEAPQIARRMKRADNAQSMLEVLRNLLNCKKEFTKEATGSAQFIWYELQADSNKNPIDEFLNINNGKIRLTDAELIKALFLQKRNFVDDAMKSGKQTELAIGWEGIENALHRDDFWQFLSVEEEEGDNRIELLLRLRYQQTHNSENPKDGALFRYYYNDIWNGLTRLELQQTVLKEWQAICDLFHVIEGWYENPLMYNYIGFLVHSGYKLYDIVKSYYSVDKDADSNDFMRCLYDMILTCLPKQKEIKNAGSIPLGYKGGRAKIKSLLLFLNVFEMNKQLTALRKDNPQVMAPAYKFPFDLYVSQKWDVEHIDSATTNDLSKMEDQAVWLDQSLKILNMENLPVVETLKNDNNFEELWKLVMQYSGSEQGDEELKDSVGNLTLLDDATNRGYGNHIFALKRVEIQKSIKNGRFVPLCTQWVFNKSFNSTSADLRKWNDEDKRQYEAFIISELNSFYELIK